jgi:uncharacterized protein with HEPN domain
MPLDSRDRALLDDIRKAAAEIQSFVANMDKTGFLSDLKTRRAVERAFEIIGEAARNFSTGARSQFPHVPFGAIIGMRNNLAHAYGRVDPERVWETATVSIPSLLAELNTE